MLGFSSRQRYFLYRAPTDMRKSFDGLSGLVNGQKGADLLSGDVFIFINRRRDRIKLLVWEGDGFAIWYKRLEEGTFELPVAEEGGRTELHWEDLVLILRGIRLSSVRRRKRYTHPTKMDGKYPQNVENKAVSGGLG